MIVTSMVAGEQTPVTTTGSTEPGLRQTFYTVGCPQGFAWRVFA